MRKSNKKMVKKIICKNCVMDTSDPKITFDKYGVCDHCNDFYKSTLKKWNPNHYGVSQAYEICEKIKASNNSSGYNCRIGLSGGLDSSYLLHLAVNKFKLKPLVFHVDAGWNTNLAVSNIEKITKKLNLDLFTEIIDWEQVKDLQLALFKSGTPHLDLAQDHAFFATMYNFAEKHKIKWILNGGNVSTEGIRNPKDWLYYGTDMSFLNDVRKRFCKTKLDKYPWSSIYKHKIYLRYIKKIKVFRLLNYVPYLKEDAKKTLQENYDWTPYPQKHFESIFTKFYEGYWLPTRFGYDTRKVQFSSLIVTGQMTREKALAELSKNSYDIDQIKLDKEYIANKLDISVKELEEYHSLPLKNFRDYKNESFIFDAGAKILRFIGAEFAVKR